MNEIIINGIIEGSQEVSGEMRYAVGAPGADGVGISDILKTSTVGNVDTYTIFLTDGTTKTFTVTNGIENIDQTYSPISENAQSGIAVSEALLGYVMAEGGKGLSSNDFTNEDKEKLYSALQNENIDQTYTPDSINAQSGIAVAEAVLAEEKRADNTFANALKGTKSDTAILLDDVSPVTHKMGVKVRNKNLIPYPYANSTKTIAGITFTVNSDGTITANGTATSNAYFEITSISTFYIPKGNYILSGCPSGGGSKTYNLTAVNGSGISYTKCRQDIGNGITLSSSGEYWIIECQVMAGQTVENITFKPQLELGTTATAYAPYVPDLTAVKVTRCGKNLIQFPYIPLTAEKTVAGITYTPLSDGGIKLNGTAIALSSAVFYNNASQGAVPITLKANLTYMASTGLSSKIGVYIRPFKRSGNSHVAITDVFTTRTITLTEDATVDQILVVVASGTTVNNVVVYPQIELGSAATSYELYDGQTYTPAANGTVKNVKSIYPTTTLTTDTNGVIIDAEYSRDINKAFAALEAAIATNNS